MTGVFSDVLQNQNIQLSMVQLEATMDSDVNLKNVQIHGLGLMGASCFSLPLHDRENLQINQVFALVNEKTKALLFSLDEINPFAKEIFDLVQKRDSILQVSDPLSCFTGDLHVAMNQA